MNIIERQTALTKSLFEINTNSLKETATLQRENLTKYFEVNREFGGRISEIKDISSLVNLQKEYNETLWSNTKEAVSAQSEIVKTAFSGTKDAVQTAFTAEEIETEESEVAVEAVKAKPKAKAKKATKAEAA